MSLSAQQLLLTAVSLACILLAAVRGGRPERWGGLAMVTAMVLSPVAYTFTHPGGFLWGVFAIDLALLAALATIFIRSGRIWAAWSSGAQMLTVALHLVRIIDTSLGSRAYVGASYLLWLGVVLPLVWAVLIVGDRHNGGLPSRTKRSD